MLSKLLMIVTAITLGTLIATATSTIGFAQGTDRAGHVGITTGPAKSTNNTNTFTGANRAIEGIGSNGGMGGAGGAGNEHHGANANGFGGSANGNGTGRDTAGDG